MTASVNRTRKLTGTAMLSAVAAVLMFLELPVFFMPSFIKMDISELPALIAAFAYGPVAGVVVCLVKNLINLPVTHSFSVGELCNFMLGVAFVVPAGLIYKRNRTMKGAVIGALVGAMAMALFSLPSNYFITYPFYQNFMPLDAILAAYQAIVPGMDSLLKCLIVFNMPFTLLKGLIDVGLTFLVYKPLSPLLHGRLERQKPLEPVKAQVK